MGHMHAMEITAMENVSLHQKLKWHLTGNHYPPIPLAMIEPAIEAINLCNEGQWDQLVATPYRHKKYGDESPAWVLIEHMHLNEFLDNEPL